MPIAKFVQEGRVLEYSAYFAIAAGDVVDVGGILGVAKRAIPDYGRGTVDIEGVYDFPKADMQLFSMSNAVFWDSGNVRAAPHSNNGSFMPLGTVVKDAGVGPTVRVRLYGGLPMQVAFGNYIGMKILAGTAVLDGSNPTPVSTGLNSILAATATMKLATTPGDDTTVVTVEWSGGTLNFYAWKHTNTSTPTLVASTNSARSVSWIAIGF